MTADNNNDNASSSQVSATNDDNIPSSSTTASAAPEQRSRGYLIKPGHRLEGKVGVPGAYIIIPNDPAGAEVVSAYITYFRGEEDHVRLFNQPGEIKLDRDYIRNYLQERQRRQTKYKETLD
jgi:hypothetical protein